MKVITLLLDGLGDRTYKELNYKTPLDYANTPNLDLIAKKSQCGLMTPISYGVSPSTDLAHFIMFNYSLDEYPTRTIIDAYGEKISFNSSDLLLRASFANVKKNEGYFINNRFLPEFSDKEINEILEVFNREIDGYQFNVIHSYDSHCFLKVSGKNLSSEISDSDPFYSNQYAMKVEAFETNELNAIKTSEIINKYLKENYDLLKDHIVNKKRIEKGLRPCNFLLTKWAGKEKNIIPFKKKTGMDGVLIGKSSLLNGIADLIEIDYIKYDNFNNAVDIALKSNKNYVHLHTKTIDTASHTKNVYNKVKEIEKIDKEISKLIDFEGLLIVTADHSTPCSGKMIHSGESVPFMAMGEFVRRDLVKRFTEIHCANGSFSIRGNEFIDFINNARDEGKLFHLRAGKNHINYIKRDINKLI